MLVKRANSLLTYGPTGHYKTTNVGRFARYEYERTGKKTRLISADGGGWAPVQAEIDVGIIEPLRIVEADQPLPLLRKLSQGYWPKAESLSLDGLDDVGAYAIEGISSISTLLLRYIVASGRKISQEVIGLFQEKINVDNKDLSVSFGAASPSHYGFVQNEVLQLIANFRALPVDRVLFTSAEAKGKDDINDNSTIYGPAATGKALTDKLPFEFGDLLHFSSVPVGQPSSGKMEVRCYLTAHPDPQTRIIWPAKPRLQPSQLGEFEKRYPEGYFVLTPERGIEDFMRFQDESREGLAQNAREWKEKIDKERGNKQPRASEKPFFSVPASTTLSERSEDAKESQKKDS